MNSQAYLWKLTKKDNQAGLEVLNNVTPWMSLDEITKTLPNGAYTTFRTYQHGSTIHFNDHIERLKETCKLSGFSFEIDGNLIRLGLKQILNILSDIPDLRVRINIDFEHHKGDVFLAAEPLVTPTGMDYQCGVRVATCSMKRTNPKAKLSRFLNSTDQVRSEFSKDFNEIIMIGNDGQMLEGLSSNFFAIKDGKIWTEDKDVLSGITRSIIFEVAIDLGIPVIKRGILLEELRYVKEVFITSASRSVLPVKQIDQYWSSSKVPGLVTLKIMRAFDENISKCLELI